MKNIKFYSLLLIIMIVSACNGLSEEQVKANKSTEEAITALKKLDASTNIGTTKIDYSKMLIDAQVSVNKASESLPDGELKKEIKSSMESYSDALIAWNNSEQQGGEFRNRVNIGSLQNKDGQDLDKKYQLKKKIMNGRPLAIETIFEDSYPKREAVLSIIWQEAKTHLEKANKLSENGNS